MHSTHMYWKPSLAGPCLGSGYIAVSKTVKAPDLMEFTFYPGRQDNEKTEESKSVLLGGGKYHGEKHIRKGR